MKDLMNKLNDKASNVCVYIICIVLLLGMVRGVADAGGGGESDVAVRGRFVKHACQWAAPLLHNDCSPTPIARRRASPTT